MSYKSDDNAQASFDPKLFMDSMMGEMKRMIKEEFGQLHERLDKIEDKKKVRSQHVPNECRRDEEQPIDIWDGMRAIIMSFVPSLLPQQPQPIPTPTPTLIPIPIPLVLPSQTSTPAPPTTQVVDITPLDPSPLIVSPMLSSPPPLPQTLPMTQVLPPSLPTHYMEPIEGEVMCVPIVIPSDEKFIEVTKDGVILHFPDEKEKTNFIFPFEWHRDEYRAVDIFKINNFVSLRWNQMKRVKMKILTILLDLRTNPFQEEGNDANQGMDQEIKFKFLLDQLQRFMQGDSRRHSMDWFRPHGPKSTRGGPLKV